MKTTTHIIPRPITKPKKYFLNQLFLLNPIEEKLLFSINFTLINTSKEIKAKDTKVISKSNKSVLVLNTLKLFNVRYKGVIPIVPISEPTFINNNASIMAQIKFGSFLLFFASFTRLSFSINI